MTSIESRTIKIRNSTYHIRAWSSADRPLCTEFARAALPCDAPVAVVTAESGHINRAPSIYTRTLCAQHYEAFLDTKRSPYQYKKRAMDEARDRLIAAHRDEYNIYFTEAIKRAAGEPQT